MSRTLRTVVCSVLVLSIVAAGVGAAAPLPAGVADGPAHADVETADAPLRGGSPALEIPLAAPERSTSVGGYSRRQGSDALDNETRVRVYDAVRERPGTYLSQVSEETGIPRSTVRYHVRVLEADGYLHAFDQGGKHRLVPAGTEHPELAAALDDDSSATVLAALADAEPATVTELADRLNRAPSTLSYHLSRLADAELITRERTADGTLARLDGDVRAALRAELRP